MKKLLPLPSKDFMFINVRLLTGYQQPLTYKVPDSWDKQPAVGSFVLVPLREKRVPALVIASLDQAPQSARTFTIKEIIDYEPFPKDSYYWNYVKQLAQYYQIDDYFCIRRIRQFLDQPELNEAMTENLPDKPAPAAITLTGEQQAVCDFVTPFIEQGGYQATLMHGVTGSGKTEVYKRLIETCFKQGKTAVLLLPEVTLALQFERILKAQLPQEIPVFSFHSATKVKEKRRAWQQLVQQKPVLLIGVHIPILLPIANLGLIIVDEEHEVGYQEKKHPTINSKEAAVWRAHTYQIPLVLGSATPSIASLYNVQTRGWKLFQLTKRYAGNFPKIETVPLLAKNKRRNFWISRELEQAIGERLVRRQQSIIFLNRRGFSFFMQCKQCSYIPTCTICSVSLTVHEDRRLSCHYCGNSIVQPTQCPSCKAPEKEILKKGIGTQQVVSILEDLFPYSKIARADLDTSSNKKLWQQTLHDFETGAIDILVGTQTITKGYHFPNVTLVGIIWADLHLHFPVYNASETTLQQLIQVAGRAGRFHDESTVIVQYMAEHPIYSYLDERTYIRFYEEELTHRRELGYPPCNRLLELALKNTDESTIEKESLKLMSTIRRHLADHPTVQLLGPSKPPIHKIKNIHTRKLYLKGPNINELLAIVSKATTIRLSSTIFLTPNPLH